MRNIDKILIVIGIICVLFIILCIALYFSKYYVIYKFQQKIDEIEKSGNYEIVSDDFIAYTKDNIYVLNYYDDSYLVSNRNTFKNYIIDKNNFQNVGSVKTKDISEIFSLKDPDDKTTFLNVKNNLEYSQLTKEILNGKECYRLVLSRKTYSARLTIYFEKKTYMPIAYNYEGDNINNVKINIGTVQDEDISVTNLYRKVVELSN